MNDSTQRVFNEYLFANNKLRLTIVLIVRPYS